MITKYLLLTTWHPSILQTVNAVWALKASCLTQLSEPPYAPYMTALDARYTFFVPGLH